MAAGQSPVSRKPRARRGRNRRAGIAGAGDLRLCVLSARRGVDVGARCRRGAFRDSHAGARRPYGICIARSRFCQYGALSGRIELARVLARGTPPGLAARRRRRRGRVCARPGRVVGRDRDRGASRAMTHVRIGKKVAPAFSLDVEFDISGVTALFGPAGAGKTLILECIAGIARPDSGRILRDDVLLFDAEARVHVPPRRSACGYLPQRSALFPHMTVRQNLAFAAGGARLERHRRVAEMLDKFVLAGAAQRRPAELDAALRTRAAVARALLACCCSPSPSFRSRYFTRSAPSLPAPCCWPPALSIVAPRLPTSCWCWMPAAFSGAERRATCLTSRNRSKSLACSASPICLSAPLPASTPAATAAAWNRRFSS